VRKPIEKTFKLEEIANASESKKKRW
jgi:hypothetical protein